METAGAAENPATDPGFPRAPWTALRSLLQLVVYPREGHSIGEYAHQLDHLSRILDWYARY